LLAPDAELLSLSQVIAVREPGLTAIVPFLVEDLLTARGGSFSRAGDWQPHAVSDGLLITGQNPASSDPVAKALLAQLG
jgi:putative intracellular protease/amidase